VAGVAVVTTPFSAMTATAIAITAHSVVRLRIFACRSIFLLTWRVYSLAELSRRSSARKVNVD
jgi:hypothetical protein